MKRNIIYSTGLLFLIGTLIMTGCKKEDFGVNVNPNAITASTVDYTTVLPSALAATASIEAGAGGEWAPLRKWLGFWARSGSFQGDASEETYSFTNNFNSSIWFNNYYNITNYNFVQKKANAAGAGFYEAIARIMIAKDFQMLVDTYGNIPYSEALQTTSNRKPKYDDDEAIYKDLFLKLDTAIAMLKDPAATNPDKNPNIAVNDLVYKGNALKWRQFANTLKLRMLIHTGNTSFAGGVETNTFVSSINQAAEMAKITADGAGFIPSGQTAGINPGYSQSKPNPYYNTFVLTVAGAVTGQADFVKANKYAVDFLRGDGDPRIDKFFTFPQASPSGPHRGVRYGAVSVAGGPDIGSKLSGIEAPGIVPDGPASKAWLFTSTESLFLQAEAIQRGLMPGNAKTALTAAIRESFTTLGLTAADADTYIAGNPGYPETDYDAVSRGPGLAPGGMYTILSQKWFALTILATEEVWTDYRRSDIVYGLSGEYLAGPPISIAAGVTTNHIPIRFLYPQEEYNLNTANAVGEGATINYFTGGGVSGKNRIFWDKND